MAEVAPLMSLEEAAKSAAKKAANQKRVRATRQKVIKEGERQYHRTPFYYADGRVSAVKMQVKSINLLAVPILTEENSVVVQGKNVTVVDTPKTKPFRFSMLSRVATSGKQKGKYVREWRSISVPDDAREIDILFNYKTWGVKPEMIEVNGKAIAVGKIKNIATKRRVKAPKPIDKPSKK